MGGCHKTTTPV